MKFKYILIFSLISYVTALPLKERDILEFIEARYSGDDSTVYSMISENFQYYHTPSIGLGVITKYLNDELIITDIIDDSLQKMLKTGDRIHEINGIPISKSKIDFFGAVGDEQKLIITQKGDSIFQTIYLPLIKSQYIQNDSLYLLDVINYGENWYDYDVNILDVVIDKEKIAVHYYWEGSKIQDGPIFHFFAMEIFYIDRKTDLIERLEGLWSEKQFRDQFK